MRGLLFWFGQAGVLIALFLCLESLSASIAFGRADKKMAGARPPQEIGFIDFVGSRSAVSDTAKNGAHSARIIIAINIKRDKNEIWNLGSGVYNWRDQPITMLCGVLNWGHVTEQPSILGDLVWKRPSDYFHKIGRSGASVSNFDLGSKGIAGFGLTDFSDDQKGSVEIKRRLGGFVKIAGDADQLKVEQSYQRSGDGAHTYKQEHDARIALIIVAALAGTACLAWACRSIGQCEWAWVLIGWMLYELALFAAFRGSFWTWIWAWACGT